MTADGRPPECVDGCPLTSPGDCEYGCLRASRVPAGVCECGRGPVVAVAEGTYPCCRDCADDAAAAGADITRGLELEVTTPSSPRHAGTEPPRAVAPRPPARARAPVPRRTPLPPDAEGTTITVAPDVPFAWRGYAALAIVLVIATVCAIAGWTR